MLKLFAAPKGLKAPIEDYCGVPHYVLYCGPEVVDRVPVPYKSFESLVKGTDDVQDQR